MTYRARDRVIGETTTPLNSAFFHSAEIFSSNTNTDRKDVQL